MRISSKLLLGCVALAVPAMASAAPFLSLVPSAGTTPILVGQTLSIDVVLNDLPAGTQLELLSATVSFPAGSFQIPLSITPGPIVPDPLADPLDFLTIADAGLADISFQTNSLSAADRITTSGVFATIVLEANAIGGGEITLSFIDAFSFNSASPDEPIPFTIEDAPGIRFDVVVPEPSAAGAMLLLSTALLRRRRA